MLSSRPPAAPPPPSTSGAIQRHVRKPAELRTVVAEFQRAGET